MYYSTDFLVCISIAPRNNVCGAREFSVNFWNSFREFSVKLGIFSETSHEITHFSPWIKLVPNHCQDINQVKLNAADNNPKQ